MAEPAPIPFSVPALGVPTLIGLLAGIGLWAANSPLVSTAAGFAVFVGTLAALTGSLFGREGDGWVKAAVFGGVLGVALGGLAWAFHAHSYGALSLEQREDDAASLAVLGAALIALVAIPFFRTVFERGRKATDYASLFETAWNMIVIGTVAAVFAGISYLVLHLAGALLDVVGIGFLQQVLDGSGTWYLVTGTAFGLGVGIIRQREGVVLAIRGIVFWLVQALGPILLLASVIFVGALAVQGFGVIEDGWSAAGLLIGVGIAGIIYLNAILGDGAAEPGRVSGLIARVQGVMVLVLFGIALFAIVERVSQYGLTPMRIVAGVIAGVGGLYGLVYAVGAVLPLGARLIRGANIPLAGLAAAVAGLLLSPLASPFSLSVPDRVARAEAAATPDVLRAELAALRMLGAPGEAAFLALASQVRAAGDATRTAQVDLVFNTTERWNLRQLARGEAGEGPATLEALMAQGLEIIPSVEAMTPAFREALLVQNWLSDGWMGVNDCVRRKAAGEPASCALVAVGAAWNASDAWILVSHRPQAEQNAPPLHLLFQILDVGATYPRWTSATLLTPFGEPGAPTVTDWLARVRAGEAGTLTATVTVPRVGGLPLLPQSDLHDLDLAGAVKAGLPLSAE
jgi:hypothetical protein